MAPEISANHAACVTGDAQADELPILFDHIIKNSPNLIF